MGQRLGEGSLGVGEDTKILLGASPELGTGSAQLERVIELFPGRLQVAALEIKVRQRVERFGGEDRITDLGGCLVAPLTQFASQNRFVAITLYHTEAAQRLGQSPQLGALYGSLDGSLKAAHGLRHAPGSLLRARLAQKISSAVGPGLLGPPRVWMRRLARAHESVGQRVAGEVIDRGADCL